jgi:TonB family protein
LEALYRQLTYPTTRSQQISDITLRANILVNSDGKVEQVSFDEDQYKSYQKAARNAIYAVRFMPGKRNGKAVDMFITIPIQFNAR